MQISQYRQHMMRNNPTLLVKCECELPVAAQTWVMRFHPHQQVVTRLQALHKIAILSFSLVADPRTCCESNEPHSLHVSSLLPTDWVAHIENKDVCFVYFSGTSHLINQTTFLPNIPYWYESSKL